MGLHQRYTTILSGHNPGFIAGREEDEKEIRSKLTKFFDGMMGALYQEKGAQFSIDILESAEAQEFIEAHTSVLDSAIATADMSAVMRDRLSNSNYIFSGMKAFHELNEAFPSLLDENGVRKPFQQFLNDVRKVDDTYNGNYLRAEYNFIQSSAEMAGRWEDFENSGDRYNLQYRTVGDSKVRPEHKELHGVTLPASDPFWEEFYPPNGWNCRCTVIQVRKSKYPTTDREEAFRRGESALAKDEKGIFRFNSGKQRKSVPDYNPYTIKRCKDCDIAKGKISLAFAPDNEVCAACAIVNRCAGDRSKTQRAIERTHYLHEMEPLLERRISKEVEGTRLNVGFTQYGNKHLFSDTFGRTRVVSREDLKNLDTYLERAQYTGHSDLTHERNDGVEHFYYFKARVNGRWVRLNVAKKVSTQPSGKTKIQYFLYSVNDIAE